MESVKFLFELANVESYYHFERSVNKRKSRLNWKRVKSLCIRWELMMEWRTFKMSIILYVRDSSLSLYDSELGLRTRIIERLKGSTFCTFGK